MKKKINNGIFYVVISFVAVLAISNIVLAYYGDAPKYNAESGATIVVNEAAQPAATVAAVTDESLGAVSGPDIYSPYLNFNGVQHWFTSSGAALSTSTPCAIKSPAATSTLIFASYQVNIATATAQFIEIAKATTAYATTTLIGTGYNLAASALLTLLASTTPIAPAGGATIFPPNSYLVFKNGWGAGNIGYSLNNAATCKAEWIQN